MIQEALKGFLRIGIFVGGCGLVLLLLEPPGSAEFVVSACSAGIGIALVAGVLAANRFLR